MKTTKQIALALLALGASACLVTAQDGPPPGDSQMPTQHQHGGQGGPGGRGFHLLPPRATEQLNLTDDQKTQIAALEADTKAKLEKILTPEQLQQLKQMRPPQRQGGPGGGPDGQGGPDGPGGQNPPPAATPAGN